MGIGISYTNADGLTSAFSASGTSSAMARLRDLQSQSQSDASALSRFRSKRHSAVSAPSSGGASADDSETRKLARKEKLEGKKAARFSGMTYSAWKAQQASAATASSGIGAKLNSVKDFLKRILGFNGALEDRNGKLALRGETTAKMGGIFGKSLRGMFGFFGLDDFDPPKLGRVIGNALNTDPDEQGDEHKSTDKSPFGEQYVSRIFAVGGELKTEGGVSTGSPIVIRAGIRTRQSTEGGRTILVGKETCVDVCSISNLYIKGDNTNIVFTPIGGKIKVDVYYK